MQTSGLCVDQCKSKPCVWSQGWWLQWFLSVWQHVATDGSVCRCGVLLSFVFFSQIQPPEGTAAQTPLAANTGVLARPRAQAGIRDGGGCTRGHGTSGCSCVCPPCVRLTPVTVLDGMLSSCSRNTGTHCSH